MTPTRATPIAFTDSIITACCMDCGEQFTGTLAVRFITTPQGKGIEIVVRDAISRSAHSITRIECDEIPTVDVIFVGEHTHGHA